MFPREVEFVLELTRMQGSEVYCVLTVRGAIEEVNILFSFTHLCYCFFYRENTRETHVLQADHVKAVRSVRDVRHRPITPRSC